MIRTFSGDEFLAGRAFLDAVRAASAAGREVVRLGEGLTPERVHEALHQGGLFGTPEVALDLDAAFKGQGNAATGVRNAVIALLEEAGPTLDALVLDAGATPARQKRWRALGELQHLPTPRYANLVRWIRAELDAAGVRQRGDVAGTLADLCGDDLPGVVAEISKLRVLDEPLTPERVIELVRRPAARNAFHLIDAIMAGDVALAFDTLDTLVQTGEPPIKVMAALAWQVDLIAGCVGLRDDDPDVDQGHAAATLKANPYPTGKALAIAARLDEGALRALVEAVVSAEQAMKSGSDPAWRLEACVLETARLMAARGAPAPARAGRRP